MRIVNTFSQVFSTALLLPLQKRDAVIIIIIEEVEGMEKENVGELLRKRRNELSLTQRQVANQVGVTEATVSRWESGDIDNMRRDKIAGLANALKVSPLLIMGVEGSEQYYRPVNGEESELLDDYRDVPAEDKNLIRGMLKRFKIGRVPALPTKHVAVL